MRMVASLYWTADIGPRASGRREAVGDRDVVMTGAAR